jgi:tetratricopeptide (TPR) repeat protein
VTAEGNPAMTPLFFQSVLVITLAAGPCLAESGYITVLVQDSQKHPVRLAEIGVEKNGGSKLTKDDGKAQLPLAQSVKTNDWITFQLVHSPPGKDLAIVSPWDNRTQVPSFADKSENLVTIVVVQRGDRAALESGLVLVALAAKVNKANARQTANQQAPPDPKEALLAVAKQYDLSADDIDAAIRAWGARTTNLDEQGMAALYERNYPKATAVLKDSLEQHEQNLEADQKRVSQDQKSVADTAFFLGTSLYEEGLYRDAAKAYQRCLTFHPDDWVVLNNLALSLFQSGNYAEAEPLYRRALGNSEGALGADDTFVAINLNNLADLLRREGDLANAEPLYRRALAIDEKAFGPDHPNVARDLGNLGSLVQSKNDVAGAEPLFRRALAIDEKTLGPDHPDVAVNLNNLAMLLKTKGDLTGAEPLVRRALAIDEKALGTDHPFVATNLNNLAQLLVAKGDFADAEPLYSRALAIHEKMLGPDFP